MIINLHLTHSQSCAHLMALFENIHGSLLIVFFPLIVKHHVSSSFHICKLIAMNIISTNDYFRHTDHLRGLGDSYFANYVQEHRSIRIRCSEATRSFLSQLSAYKHLSRIYSLVHVNQPMAIQHPDDES